MTREQEAKWRAAIKPLVLEMHKHGMKFAEIGMSDIKNVILRISADALDGGDEVEFSSDITAATTAEI